MRKTLIKYDFFKIDILESELYIYNLYLIERFKSPEEVEIYKDTFDNIFYMILDDKKIQGSFLIFPLSHFLTFQELRLISYLNDDEKNIYLTLKKQEEEFYYEYEKRKRESY